MKQTSENLEKRVEHLRRLRDDCRLKGQKCLKANDKAAAKNQLIYMRKYEKEIESLYGKRMNLETQVMALQSTAVDRDVLQAMRMGRDVMRTVINDQSLDQAMDLMDDIQEVHTQNEEMSSALSRPIGEVVDIDDDELLREFEQQDVFMENVEKEYDASAMPTVPVSAKKEDTVEAAPTDEVDEEAKQLAALMGI
jgi:short-subunit dehydrogenase involved in D-alanine esterification of teichoic acids